MSEQTTAELVRVFKAKAPVCLCVPGAGCKATPCVEWCGPQRTAAAAYRVLLSRGVETPIGVGAAMLHAHAGEGRGEFDALVADWTGTP